MTDPRDQLQTTLGTAYTLERELGGGGMSRVYLAQETALGRQVVVKVVAPELAEGLSAERFAREVKLAARLQQANIVPVLTAGDAGGLPYYTMPFVKGESLRARLAQGPLPSSEAISVLRDVARALAYAHAEGVVHRDIKPENILLSGGAAVVTDFGIAKAISASRTLDGPGAEAGAVLTQTGSSIGTPAYMPPEQAAGDSIDQRADLYAWGVVAYELLAGAHPFAGKASAQQLIAAHLTEVPVSLATKRPELPAMLTALVMRCLEKDPARRPPSASVVLEQLDAVGTPGSNETPPISRSRQRAFLIGAAVFVIATILIARPIMRHAKEVSESRVFDKSLAVLPFESVGGDTANAYFAEGIADELTTAFARLPGLRLAGRSSAARFAGKGSNAQEVGAALHVGAVLDGTVRRAGDRIRVSAELSSAEDGRVLWTETYERELRDVFAVQDDITRAIVTALQVRLGADQEPGAGTQEGTKDVVAYDLYLRGLQLYRKRGPGMAQAEQYLQQAIARDSTFARAYATLALVLIVEPYFLGRPVHEVLPLARTAAERAIALDDGLADAHLAMGHLLCESFQWTEAEAELRRAVALDPNRAEMLYRLGFMLLAVGRVHEAVTPLEQATTVDPYYPIPLVYLAWALVLDGRADEGVVVGRRALEIDSTNEAVRNIVAATYMDAGRLQEAGDFARRAAALTTNPRRLGFFAAVLGRAGATADAEAIIRRLQALPPATWGLSGGLAYGYLGLGDTARALTAMERAAAGDGEVLFSQLPTTTLYDPVRQSPRFAAILRRYNLDVARLTAPASERPR